MRRVTIPKVRQFLRRDTRGKIRTIREWINGSFDGTLTFTTHGPCPVKCNCCPWEVYRKATSQFQSQMLSFNDFQRMLLRVPKSVVINFGGFTEAAINPMMPLMAQYAYQKGHPIEVFTTLIGMSDTGMEILSGITIDKLCIHVPDSTNTIYDTDKWLNILRRFKKYKPKNVTYGALGEVDQRIVEEIGHGMFFNSHVFNKHRYYEDRALTNIGPLKCSFNHTGLNIDQNCVAQNGDVCICSQDYEMTTVIGNLLTQTYQEVMDSPVRREFRRRMLTQNEDVLCRHCPHGTPLTEKEKDPRYEHKWRNI